MMLQRLRIWLFGDPLCKRCEYYHSGNIHIDASLTINKKDR